MVKLKPQYIELDEFYEISNNLSNKHYELFGSRCNCRIRAYAICNKSRHDESQAWWSVIHVRDPLCDIFEVDYVFKLFLTDWDAMLDKNRYLLVADALLSIDPVNEGINKFDIQDHSLMIKNFGLDYLENGDSPDILKDTFTWK